MKWHKEFLIGKKMVGIDHPTFFIADIAANHDGDLARAKDLIYLAKEAGADAAKFQHFSAKTIVSDFWIQGHRQSKNRINQVGKVGVVDTYKDASLSTDWSQELKDTCDDAEALSISQALMALNWWTMLSLLLLLSKSAQETSHGQK